MPLALAQQYDVGYAAPGRWPPTRWRLPAAPPGAYSPPRRRASGEPALDAAGRAQARTTGHGQDGGLVTGRRRGWGYGWGCSGRTA
jgi:hypothetical protein